MNQLQKVFDYQGKQVRTKIEDEEPWFVAKDVCDVLEYSNHNQILKRLHSDEKGVNSIDTPGGTQEMTMVNEPGLYHLVLGSKKKEAKQFKRWITHEVLPEIRKTGSYRVKPKSELDVLRGALDEIEKAQKTANEAKQIAQNIKETIIHTDEDWRNWVNQQLNSIAFKNKNYREIRKQSYDILENRARCRLGVRLDNLKERLEKAGATQTEINNANKLDVIESDTRLKEIYTSVVEKLTIKYTDQVVVN